MKNKLLSIILSCFLVVSIIPAPAFAESATQTAIPADKQLSSLGLYTDFGCKIPHKLEPEFNPEVGEYTIVIPENGKDIYFKPVPKEGNTGTIKVEYTTPKGTAMNVTVDPKSPLKTSIYAVDKFQLNENSIKILIDDVPCYTVNIKRAPMIEKLDISNENGDNIKWRRPDNITYTAEINKDDKLKLKFWSPVESRQQYKYTVNGKTYGDSEIVEVTPVWSEDRTYDCNVAVDVEGLRTNHCVIHFTDVGSKVKSLELLKAPDKVEYNAGDLFDPKGIEVKANLADDSSKTLTEDEIEFDKTKKLKAGQEFVTITYKEGKLNIPISVALPLKGDGTAESPYLISKVDEVNYIKTESDAGNNFKDKYFKLTADVTLPADWQPIGNSYENHFAGHIDGSGHTLTVPKGGLPLFGYVEGASVKNLNLYGEQIEGFGLINYYEGRGKSGTVVTLDNITIKKGTKTLRSGLIGGIRTKMNGAACASAKYVVDIKNCTAEKGTVIGYTGDQEWIGTFAGRVNGRIDNCISYADVKGSQYVGGIASRIDNAMGEFKVTNSEFYGTVTATDKYAGGIVGGGYDNSTAPNGFAPIIENCKSEGTIAGTSFVGGITGGDEYVVQAWDKDPLIRICNNVFTGKVSGTDKEKTGGIIGYYTALNKQIVIENNLYVKDCGAEKGIGGVKYVDTNYPNPKAVEGTTYVNTEKDTSNCPEVKGCDWQLRHNRTDDPLGKDADKLTKVMSEKNPITKLELSGEYKTKYFIGEKLDLDNLKVEAVRLDGTKELLNNKDIAVSGFDSSKPNPKLTLTVKYKDVSANFDVVIEVNPNKPVGTINVKFTLYGDEKHNSDKDKKVHTLKDGNLQTWVPEKTYTVKEFTSVKDLLEKVLAENNMTCNNPDGTYVESITRNGVTIGGLTNGVNSGWMYTLNGIHSNKNVQEQLLEDGDVVIFHYTDDFTVEEDAIDYNAKVKEVEKLIDAIGKVTKDSLSKINAARDAYTALPDEYKNKVGNIGKLEAAEKAYADIAGPVKPSNNSKKAKKVYDETSVIYDSMKSFSYGDEWVVIGLSRGGHGLSKDISERYYQSVLQELERKNGILAERQYSDYSRTIIGLTAAGYDPTNIGGYNLVNNLADFNKINMQGFNGPVWALIALDSHNYNLPEGSSTTRAKLVDELLAHELDGGGWTYAGTKKDVDMTGMVIQALAPYYNTDARVHAAVDRGLEWLSTKQKSDGSFVEYNGESCSESTAQVIVALTALGINPENDTRFIKNGKTMIDGLLEFYLGNGQFEHLKDNGANGMATYQSYYALAAYLRLLDGKTSLYNMTDVKFLSNPGKAETVLPELGPKGNATVVTDKESVKIAPSEIKNLTNELTVKLADKTVKYDKKAMDAIKKRIPADAKNVEIVLEKVEKGYNNKQAETIKESKALGVFSVKLIVTRADGTMFEIHDFNGGKATITVPFANPKNLKLEVHRVEADGSLKLMNSTYKNGMISWVTDGHSYYMVTEEGTAKAATEKTTPKTGDTNNMIPWSVLLLGAAGAVTLIRRKKNSNYN